MKTKRRKSVELSNRREIEDLMLAIFTGCPFCRTHDMRFIWGQLVPKRMTCQNCDATWEPLLSY